MTRAKEKEETTSINPTRGYTVREVSYLEDCSESTTHRRIKSGELPAYKIGKRNTRILGAEILKSRDR